MRGQDQQGPGCIPASHLQAVVLSALHKMVRPSFDPYVDGADPVAVYRIRSAIHWCVPEYSVAPDRMRVVGLY